MERRKAATPLTISGCSQRTRLPRDSWKRWCGTGFPSRGPDVHSVFRVADLPAHRCRCHVVAEGRRCHVPRVQVVEGEGGDDLTHGGADATALEPAGPPGPAPGRG